METFQGSLQRFPPKFYYTSRISPHCPLLTPPGILLESSPMIFSGIPPKIFLKKLFKSCHRDCSWNSPIKFLRKCLPFKDAFKISLKISFGNFSSDFVLDSLRVFFCKSFQRFKLFFQGFLLNFLQLFHWGFSWMYSRSPSARNYLRDSIGIYFTRILVFLLRLLCNFADTFNLQDLNLRKFSWRNLLVIPQEICGKWAKIVPEIILEKIFMNL